MFSKFNKAMVKIPVFVLWDSGHWNYDQRSFVHRDYVHACVGAYVRVNIYA